MIIQSVKDQACLLRIWKDNQNTSRLYLPKYQVLKGSTTVFHFSVSYALLLLNRNRVWYIFRFPSCNFHSEHKFLCCLFSQWSTVVACLNYLIGKKKKKKELIQLVSPVPPASFSPAAQIRYAKYASKRFLTAHINLQQCIPNKASGQWHVTWMTDKLVVVYKPTVYCFLKIGCKEATFCFGILWYTSCISVGFSILQRQVNSLWNTGAGSSAAHLSEEIKRQDALKWKEIAFDNPLLWNTKNLSFLWFLQTDQKKGGEILKWALTIILMGSGHICAFAT